MINSFRDLFRRKKPEPEQPASHMIETAPLYEEQVKPLSPSLAPVKIHPPQLNVGCAQSVGVQRDHNEDTLFAMQSIFADTENDLPFGIFIIADGMGGHLNGEIASGAAARTMSQHLLNRFYVPFLSGQADTMGESIHEILESGVREAQRSVLRSAPGGGTTLTAALLIDDQVTITHVGDSRAYFLHPDGRVETITQDHTLVKRLQDLGQIDEKEASVHPQRNVLYRALGQSEPFRPDIHTHTLPPGSYLMLCSDGLWGVISEDALSRIVFETPSLAVACQRLVEEANLAGGPDNISVVLVQYLS